ncbi:MAG: LCP family protein [Lachnospiraceae bacterium]|nr:LCP family protein [Lachnospiraceae bacterium]
MGRKQRGEKNTPAWAKALLISLSVIALVLLIVFAFIWKKWQRADYLTADMFQANAANTIPVHRISQLDEAPPRDGTSVYQEDNSITYKGKQYRYNDNLINILVMGIDDYSLVDEVNNTNPFQADTLVVGTVDAVQKTVSFLCIPRDTVTDVKVLDLNNEVASKKKAPIAVSHSYGTQGAETNEAVVGCVSDLLYNLPIYRYVAIDISAIPDINDSLGGITVDIPEDLTKWNPKMKEGISDYLLKGKDAVIFVARRDTSIDDSAMGRMKRQMQYMKKLFPALKSQTAKNITYPITLYNNEADKVATNLSIDEMTYLAKLMLDLELDEDNVAVVPGQMKKIEPGEIDDYEYEMGYIVDEDALKDLIIERYYTEQ